MKDLNFSFTSALVGAAAATATSLMIFAKPRDPTFQVISIELTSFKLNFPLLDAELTLTVHVTNPNIVPIHYPETEMSIFYAGTLLGSAPVKAGSQGARSCEMLHLQARLSGLQLANNVKKFLSDVARREMVLDSTVDIRGSAKVMCWEHKFKVHVDSHLTVDPIFLDVIEQENNSRLEVFVKDDDEEEEKED